ncbi:MAG: LamG-like jellyroll fold domain-containing protein [Kiritimatiellales bacterium]
MKKWMLILTVLLAAVCRADYVDEVMADSPEAYYRFEEPLESVQMQDSSGNGHDSVAVSNVTFERNGIIGWSGGFATNGSVRLDFNRSPAAGDFSVECLVQFPDPTLNCTLVSQRDGSGTGRAILYQEDGMLKSFLGGIETAVAEPPASNLWHHLVLTSDLANRALTLYIDGRIAAEQSVTVEAADGDWILGMDSAGQAGHQGRLDEVAVYPHCLENARILRHFQYLRGMHPLYYVATNGTSVAPFSSWETAATNVQEAVNLAVQDPRSTVMLGEGAFYVDGPFVVGGAYSAGPEHHAGYYPQNSAGITLMGPKTVPPELPPEYAGANGEFKMPEHLAFIIPVGVSETNVAIRISHCTMRNLVFGSPLQSGRTEYMNLDAENCYFWAMHVQDHRPFALSFVYSALNRCSFSCFPDNWDSYNPIFDCGPCQVMGCVCDRCAFYLLYKWNVETDLQYTLTTKYNIFRRCMLLYCYVDEYMYIDSQHDQFVNCGIDIKPEYMTGLFSVITNCTDPTVLLGSPYYIDRDGKFAALGYDQTEDIDGDGVPNNVELSLNRIPMLDQEERLNSLYAEGQARGIAAVQKTPSAYGLYTSNSILELSQGGWVRPASDGQAHLNLQLEQCTNLVGGAWTNVGSAVDWRLDLPSAQPFFRVKGTE